ncbi:MAG: ATP phosphoribosyltransferase regulatory subunit [Prochloraceae cyanobacterium]|nr:ATP phosphoribosyltransferase regulatory subunit [Prochloraceae cyanobacterium]
MIYQPPAGARDLLPLEVAQKCWINDRLQQIFGQWGYQRIVTSTLEKLDTLMAGGAIEHSTVIQLQDRSEGTLGLRPELTASIARAAVTRMNDNNFPQRLCYRANIFRNPTPSDRHGRQLEFYQAGVELLFSGGILADAEIILLLADCFHQLGVEEWHLIIGEAGLTRNLLSPFPKTIRKQVRACLANLDRIAIEELDLSPELRERALFIFDLRGKPADVLQKVASLDLDESGQEIVNKLKSLSELLEASSSNSLPIILDLSLLQTIDYYTGIIFKAISYKDDRWHLLGQGGRYDRLLAMYHPQGQTFPGIGFSLNVEDLHSCLLPTSKLPQQTPASDWLVIAKTPESEAAALICAKNLRAAENLVRVEIDLGGRSPEEIREYARSCRIKSLAWVEADGNATVEKL